jgi:hypothetical protein
MKIISLQFFHFSNKFFLILQPYFHPFLTLSDHIFINFETSTFLATLTANFVDKAVECRVIHTQAILGNLFCLFYSQVYKLNSV